MAWGVAAGRVRARQTPAVAVVAVRMIIQVALALIQVMAEAAIGRTRRSIAQHTAMIRAAAVMWGWNARTLLRYLLLAPEQ